MKYFEKEDVSGVDVIGMRDEENDSKNVFLIEKLGNFINFFEGGHRYYSRLMSKEEAIDALKEAIAWIESEE